MTASAHPLQPNAREREVLEARARALARVVDSGRADATSELLAFSLATDVYAVDTREVTGVFRLAELTPVPGADPRVAGLTVWRGSLLTVLDLRQVLGLPATGLDDRAWVVVLVAGGAPRGLLAGALQGIIAADRAAMREPGPGLRVDRRFVRAVTDGAVVVLDGPTLISRQTET
ncbi:MAG: chemotaxis protein CheW [Gemmatimonadota bacterium]|nr:chemotaxis protein CheW [Gemmatimonadota bacterium]